MITFTATNKNRIGNEETFYLQKIDTYEDDFFFNK